jgi:dephospho-CoA kinase
VLTIGLTGGIGSGKSTVSARLALLGAVVVDADRIAREVVEPGTDGLAEVVEAFGPEVLGPDGALDRAALGRIVFSDDERRRALEKIIHPRVRERTVAIASAAAPDAVMVNDIPLLVETGAAASYDLVIVVLAREETRIARLRVSRGMSDEEVRTRIAAQATDEQRREVADIVIENDGSREELLAEVDRIWRAQIEPRAR